MMAAEHITATKTSFYRTLPGKLCTAWLLLGVLTVGACRNSGPQSEPNEPSEPNVAQAAPPTDNSLFDGKTLGNWKITDFGGQGNVYVKDGSIYLEMGNDMTGITWAAPLPAKTNYEITLEAMRVDGSDFFCGLTFPVGENFCSLVLGGWGGTLCGLSNIDYYDAANNETTRIVSFETGKWYHVRLHVRPNRIQAWLQEEGEEPLVDMDITDRKIDTRAEMDMCQPMGVATWQTSGAVRNIHMRKLPD
ncbi:MAG: 3-keto-disaccharide hydrolase [Planctomycetota bacterium]|jgi:hypothetical protein